ncbi:hypothetical protein AN414_24330 [Serratia marcescens]|nr:hypothetical protein AN414_24330 [Serratia marcescens]
MLMSVTQAQSKRLLTAWFPGLCMVIILQLLRTFAKECRLMFWLEAVMLMSQNLFSLALAFLLRVSISKNYLVRAIHK